MDDEDDELRERIAEALDYLQQGLGGFASDPATENQALRGIISRAIDALKDHS